MVGFSTNIAASYGGNDWIYNTPVGTSDVQGRNTAKNWRKIHAVNRSSDTPLMADAMWRGGGPDVPATPDSDRPAFNGEWSGAGHEFKHFAIARHGKVTQLDNHVHARATRQSFLRWRQARRLSYVVGRTSDLDAHEALRTLKAYAIGQADDQIAGGTGRSPTHRA